MPDHQFLTYESPDDGRIVPILLNRPEYRNVDEDGIPDWEDAPPIVPAVKDQVRADA